MTMHSGITRSSIQANHALITPESHIRTTLPGWTDTDTVILISPHMGAEFTQYHAYMKAGSNAGMPPIDVQRFIYVLEGAVAVATDPEETAMVLGKGGFAYFPANAAHTLTSPESATLIVFEKFYEPLDGAHPPAPIVGHEKDVPEHPFNDDPDALLKELLPAESSMDFAINVFDFKPGGSLPLVEVHFMEHGLSVLQGQGIYRLDESWYPVQQGDTIWMGPYCPQWYCAIGKTSTRYLYYKNMHRHPNTVG